MNQSPANSVEETAEQRTRHGIIAALMAYTMWGLFPIYFKIVSDVEALEMLAHRIVWSLPFGALIIWLRHQWPEVKRALSHKRTFGFLALSALVISVNWLTYIYAVQNEHIFQASLGYYINPLVNVVLGMVFLRERLRAPQILAVVLATVGVIYLTVYYGEFPWIALALAVSFGLYGLIRKIAPVGSLAGLTVETLLLSIPALVYLFYLDGQGAGHIFRVSLKVDLLLMGCALATAIPLLFFTLGARRLYLTTVGLLQYIAPSCMFLLAVFLFREPLVKAQVVTFIFIWTALAIYSTDSVRYYKRAEQNLSNP